MTLTQGARSKDTLISRPGLLCVRGHCGTLHLSCRCPLPSRASSSGLSRAPSLALRAWSIKESRLQNNFSISEAEASEVRTDT